MNYNKTLAILGLCLGLNACSVAESKTSPVEPPKQVQTYSVPEDTLTVKIDGIHIQVKGCSYHGCNINVNGQVYYVKGEVPQNVRWSNFDSPSLEGKLVAPEEETLPETISKLSYHSFARGDFFVNTEGQICGKNGTCQPHKDFPEIKGVIVSSTPRSSEVLFAVYFRKGPEFFGKYN